MQFQNFLTFENIYLWINFGILPFWLMLVVMPRSNFTQFFVNSVILPLILSATYIYVIYQAILLGEPILDLFMLYSSIENLYTIFSSESFLLVFWLHFLSLNLFLASWISRDGVKYNMTRGMVFIPIVLVLYWLMRVFYAKRLSIHD
jgi:hypothetical protein